MRHRRLYQHYLVIIVLCALMLNFSPSSVGALRCGVLTLGAPITGTVNICKAGVHSLLATTAQAVSPRVREKKKNQAREIERLHFENERLQQQVTSLMELVGQENQLRRQLLGDSASFGDMMQKCQEGLQARLQKDLQAVSAKVVYRGFSSWMSSLWLDVGQHTNKRLGATIVAKNSPVVIGNAVVGVIEHVGKYRSRMRLITDVALTPSVRAVRGQIQNRELLIHTEALLEAMEGRDDLAGCQYLEALHGIKEQLLCEHQSWFCAKGELCGFNKGLWRRSRGVLRGTGFNYDFSDDRGPARDLRTGQAVDPADPKDVVPVLKKGDLLVTTGLDGVFPEGLFVARVTHIDTLREGGYYYDLEARPVISNLDDISQVFVLPPVAGGG